MQKSELLRNDQINFGSARDLVAIVFRKKRIIVLAFLVFAALGIFWALTFPRYESEM